MLGDAADPRRRHPQGPDVGPGLRRDHGARPAREVLRQELHEDARLTMRAVVALGRSVLRPRRRPRRRPRSPSARPTTGRRARCGCGGGWPRSSPTACTIRATSSKLKTRAGWRASTRSPRRSSLRVATRAWYDAVFDATDRYPANVRARPEDRARACARPSWRSRTATSTCGSAASRSCGARRSARSSPTSSTRKRLPRVHPAGLQRAADPDLGARRHLPPGAGDHLRGRVDARHAAEPAAQAGRRVPVRPLPSTASAIPVVRLPDDADEFSLARSEGGVRLSVLREGWDVSLIYYDQADKSPVVLPAPGAPAARARRDRCWSHAIRGCTWSGATLGKSIGDGRRCAARSPLTIGKRYETTDPLDARRRRPPRHDRLPDRRRLHVLRRPRHRAAGEPEDPDRLRDEPHPARRRGVVTTSVALRVTTGFFDNTLNPTVLAVVGRQPRRPAREPSPGLAGDRLADRLARRRPLRGAEADAVRAVRPQRPRDPHHHLEVLT